MRNNKPFPINQCALYKCASKKKLEQLLNIETGDLKNIHKAIQYRKFEIDKKNSDEKRSITAPEFTLKTIQKRIFKLLERIERPEWLISGQKKKCYIDNGKYHQQSSYVLTLDIKSFYDNCQRNFVYRFFKDKLRTSSDVAQILTDIVTSDGKIPTGCPTSQLIAFYAYEEMFSEVKEIVDKHNCLFTVYVDDLTISSKSAFDPRYLVHEISCVLRRYNHQLKREKIKFYSPKQAKPITGTIVTGDHRIVVPNHLQKKIYYGFQELKTAAEEDDHENTRRRIETLKGQILAANQIEFPENPQKFPEISRLTTKISETIPQDNFQKKKQVHKKIKHGKIRIHA